MVKLLESVDPGKSYYASAIWRDGVLFSAFRFQFVNYQIHKVGYLHGPRRLVIEEPQVYQGHKNYKGADSEDLLQVAKTVGMVIGNGATQWESVAVVKPAEWKGQVPKTVMQHRIESRLTAREKDTLENMLDVHPKSKQHDIWDAVGIGLWYLKRL